MSLMDQVRDLRAEQSVIEESSVAAARGALRGEIARSAPARRRRRMPRWAGIGIGGLVAGTAVTAIVVGSVLAPVSAPDAAAAAVFEKAADVTVGAQDTTLLPGQFLKIETASEFLQFWRADWAHDDDENTFAFNATRADADAAVLVRDTRTLYVPADRAADWYYDWGARDVARFFGPEGPQAAADWADSGQAISRDSGTVETLPGGEFLASDGDVPNRPYLADSYRPYYSEMPRNPHSLLEWLRGQSGMSGAEADRWLIAGLSDPSRINLIPSELRASFFNALALIPGFEVVDVDGDLTTLQYAVAEHRTTVFTVNTSQGLIESISEQYGSEGLAAGTPESLTRVSMSVVDAAP